MVEATNLWAEAGEAEAVGEEDPRSQEDALRTPPKSVYQKRCLASSVIVERTKVLQCVRMDTSAWPSL